MSDEVMFEPGMRVRLRCRPAVSGVVIDPFGTGVVNPNTGQVAFNTDETGTEWRYPEELVAAPMPAEWYLGKTIRSRYSDGGEVVMIRDGLLVTRKMVERSDGSPRGFYGEVDPDDVIEVLS